MSHDTERNVKDIAKDLEDAITAKLAKLAGTLDSVRADLLLLGEDARAINGLRGLAQAVSGEIENSANKLRAEANDVAEAISGKKRPAITQTVNHDLAAAVAADPARAKSK